MNAPNWILDGKDIGKLNDEYKEDGENGGLVLCPLSEPYFTDSQCVKCSKEKAYFSLTQKECVYCYNYDSKQRKCLDSKGDKTNFEEVPSKLLVPKGKLIEDYAKEEEGELPCPQK